MKHPFRNGVYVGAGIWGLVVGAIVVDETRLARRQKRLAVQGVSQGSAVRYVAAPAGASTPSGGLTAPLDQTEGIG